MRASTRSIAEARAAGGDVVCFAHGHVLRALAARWLGQPAAFGGHLALSTGAICVLGYEREIPVLWSWNDPTPSSAPPTAARTIVHGAAGGSGAPRGAPMRTSMLLARRKPARKTKRRPAAKAAPACTPAATGARPVR